MELTLKVKAESFCLVRMDEAGVVSGKIVGHMSYAETPEMTAKGAVPMCSAEVLFTEEENDRVRKVLSEIAEEKQDALAAKLNDARAEARRVGRAMGELI